MGRVRSGGKLGVDLMTIHSVDLAEEALGVVLTRLLKPETPETLCQRAENLIECDCLWDVE